MLSKTAWAVDPTINESATKTDPAVAIYVWNDTFKKAIKRRIITNYDRCNIMR